MRLRHARSLIWVLVYLASFPATTFAQGTVTVPLANVSPTCINVTQKTVDFWILSARVPQNATFFTSTSGVGVRVDVQISGQGEKVSFPAAASISTKDINGEIVRAALALHVLADQDLWNTTDPSAPSKTTNVSVPLTFVRNQGSSDTVKVMKALINFTNSAGSAIPPNPYVKGAQLAGQLASSVLNVFTPDPNEVVDPNFSLAFGLSRADTGCSGRELQQGVGAEIVDANHADEAKGLISTSEMSKYCFYQIGQDGDPDIGFISKSGASCAADIPANVNTLNNSQFIWLAYGHCKEGATTCNVARTPNASVVNKVAAQLKVTPNFADVLSARIGDTKAIKFVNIVQAQKPSAVAGLGKDKDILNALALCKSVGISAERCVSRKFGG
jgi:hypothetical protein